MILSKGLELSREVWFLNIGQLLPTPTSSLVGLAIQHPESREVLVWLTPLAL